MVGLGSLAILEAAESCILFCSWGGARASWALGRRELTQPPPFLFCAERPHSVAEAELELVILLPPPPNALGDRQVPPHLAQVTHL